MNKPIDVKSEKIAAAGELLGGALTTFDATPMPKVPLKIDYGTRLVLVNPDRSREHSIAKFVPSPYHGTWRLKHYLERRHNWPTAVIDFNIHDRYAVMKDLEKYRPPFIGFAYFYDTLQQDLENLWAIRCISPDSFYIAGGIEATARAAEYIAKLPLEGLLRGEGEFALSALMAAAEPLDQKIDKDALIEKSKDIPGWLFKRTDGAIQIGKPAKTITEEQYSDVFETYNIDPVDYEPYWNFIDDQYEDDLLEVLDVNPKMVRLITSNYCPYGCAFCVSTNFLKMASEEKKVKVVGASADQLFEKVQAILDRDSEIFIYFDDENFMAMPARARELCEKIIDSGLVGKFGCRATAQMITDDICSLMSRAGFKVVAFGAESWDDDTLKDFNKRLENDRSDIAIHNIMKNNMRCSFNVILFAPKMSRGGLIKTCDKIVKYIGLDCNVGITTYIAPYPGTAYFGNDAYHVVDGTLTVPGTGATLAFPQAILPSDDTLRAVAEASQQRGREIISEWKEYFDWRYEIVPREVSCLALIAGVYRELGIYDEAERRITILGIVERILRNRRTHFVRTTPNAALLRAAEAGVVNDSQY